MTSDLKGRKNRLVADLAEVKRHLRAALLAGNETATLHGRMSEIGNDLNALLRSMIIETEERASAASAENAEFIRNETSRLVAAINARLHAGMEALKPPPAPTRKE